MQIQLAGPWSETSNQLAVKEPIRKTRQTEQSNSKRGSKGRVVRTIRTSCGGGGNANWGGRVALKKKSALTDKDLDRELDSYLKAR
ncbi:hypothetical protein TCAL_14532 [Tigriopus californicus]|uniref:Chromatin target of PRMT1 protein C-terminal domain-containing protein n=1 Tax=Tigriopus californicus TaxID=6832 RepID=A0A553PT75_TIGCA|nr:hypothetical protein TCAL_14532 [Tigriopus californicus]